MFTLLEAVAMSVFEIGIGAVFRGFVNNSYRTVIDMYLNLV